MINKSVLEEIKKSVAYKANRLFANKLEQIILYGSYARGDYDEDSDIDIMIIVDIKREELANYRKEIAVISSKLSLDYDVTVSIHLQDLETVNNYQNVLPYYTNIMREGMIVNV